MEITEKLILSTAYLAPIEYFAHIQKAAEVFMETNENYTKQTYRNRCEIYSANGILSLVIPIEKSPEIKQNIKDVRISYIENWQKNHWRAIESAYNSSPFFLYYKDDIYPFFEKRFTFLFDFNQELLNTIFELIEVEKEIQPTLKFVRNYDDALDLRYKISPKIRKSNLPEYYQVFKLTHGFISNLSIIDLLFNEGSNTQTYLDRFY